MPPTTPSEDTFDDWDAFEEDAEDDDAFGAMLGAIARAPQVELGLTAERLMEPTLGVGSNIDGRYELLEVIGKGGFGIIYRARQVSTGDLVAVKVMLGRRMIKQDFAEQAQRRFKREMTLVGQLDHPNIVRLIDSGSLESGLMYMVLEYIEGRNLAEVLEDDGALKPGDARRLMIQVLEALCVAHAQGIVHRDLKPHNIMVTEVDGRRKIKVLDFGIASVIEETHGADLGTLTITGQIVGTPWYMAPEQLRGERKLQSDIYAWGLIFLECLTGERVIHGKNAPKAIQHQLSEAPITLPDPWARSSLASVLRRALSKPLEGRFESVEEVLEALEASARAVRQARQSAGAVNVVPSLSAETDVDVWTRRRLIGALVFSVIALLLAWSLIG